ncbi:hypothetical protein BJY52DRAFT_199265 [Lactarius psammicola]|nr:hypothetical protein BJY52DRAFT_199265 [Lactarius psammicola]
MSGLSFFPFVWAVVMGHSLFSLLFFLVYEFQESRTFTRTRAYSNSILSARPPFLRHLCLFLLYIGDFKVCMIYILYLLCMRNASSEKCFIFFARVASG